MSEEEKSVIETEYLLFLSSMEIIEELNTPVEECIKESDVVW